MGLFGGKASHDKSVAALLRFALQVFQFCEPSSTSSALEKLKFERADSRFRLLLFGLATAHTACAARMRNPDAALNEVMSGLVTVSLAPEPLPGESTPANVRFAGPSSPQAAANLAAQCVSEFLDRWSAWVDIQAAGNSLGASTGVVAGMLRDVESVRPAEDGDAIRLMPLAYGIEAMLPHMRAVL